MYKAITRCVQAKVLPNEDISLIVPNATSIQNARTSSLGDTLTRDGYHLSYDVGRYIAGVTFFHAVTGMDISNLTYAPDGVGEEVRKIAIESAINAVKNLTKSRRRNTCKARKINEKRVTPTLKQKRMEELAQ